MWYGDKSEVPKEQDGKGIGVFIRQKQLLLVVLMYQMVEKCLWKKKCIADIRTPARKLQLEQKIPIRFLT